MTYVKDLTIGQLAAAAGVPTSTVRFYERGKLLTPDARTGGNYRAYSNASLERLKFIRAAQASGFNLSDIREMLALTHSDDEPCKEIATSVGRLAPRGIPMWSSLAKSLETCSNGSITQRSRNVSR